MGTTLSALQRLQTIETQLAEVRNRIEAKKRRVRAQERKLSEMDDQIAHEQKQLRARQIEADRLELDFKTREAAVNKLREALNSAKTNKEYAAILTELNTSKVDLTKIEERWLAASGELEEFRKNISASGDTRTTEEAKLAKLREDVSAIEASSKARLDELTAKRDAAAAEVPPGALQLFQRVAANNDGVALAMVIRTNPKREEYACEQCNMSITLQQVNTLMSRDDPVTCNTCGHILLLESHAATAR